MKKLLKISLITIICIIYSNSLINPALWGSTWYTGEADLYKQIDEWISNLEETMYEYEVSSWWWSIKVEINRILKEENIPQCIEEEITSEELKEISAWNIGLLSEKIWTKCYSDEEKYISNADIIDMQKKIHDIDINSQKKAEKKSKILHKISQIWLYSDWNLDNSPFDLISDMQEIDEIIFSEKINYDWEIDYDLDSLFDDFLKDKAKESEANLWEEIPLASTNEVYSCLDDINNTNWINEDFWNILSSNISDDLSWLDVNSFTDYEKVTDNSMWPCTSFFCINIDFVTYDHKLLWWWGDWDYTIESVIKRSNEHLKKFTNVSLSQSKMWNNLFELNLRDLSLPDSFHVWLIVTRKPIPILDIEPKWKKYDGEFAYKNILYEYYKNLWLDYPRKNSLIKYNHKEEKLKALINSAERWTPMASNKHSNYIGTLELSEKKNKFFSKAINKKILTEDMSNVYNNLAEIERFIWGINDYTTALFWAVKWMDRIPVHQNW